MPVNLKTLKTNIVPKSVTEITPTYFSAALTGNGVRQTGALNSMSNIRSTGDVLDLLKNSEYEIGPAIPVSPHVVPSIIGGKEQSYSSNWTPIRSKNLIEISPNRFAELHPIAVRVIKTTDRKSFAAPIYTLFQFEKQNGRFRIVNYEEIDPFEHYDDLMHTHKQIIEALADVSLYENIKENAKDCAEKADKCFRHAYTGLGGKVESLLRFYNELKIPMTAYDEIYKFLAGKVERGLKEEEFNKLIGTNKHLELCQYLEKLNAKKATLPRIMSLDKTLIPEPSSVEQKAAITTDEPLVILQAGAGTGKTATIVNRLEYMKRLGMNLKDVIALSFTNAAADNLKERYPDVKSMTIASMVNSIYTSLHPAQELRDSDGLRNLIRIRTPMLHSKGFTDDQINYAITAVSAKEDLNIIPSRFDFLMGILDEVGGTTLNIQQSVIGYVLTSLKPKVNEDDPDGLPSDLLCEHMIIDEVQDSSLSEFVMALKYADTFNTSLYLVGDCSQTLYEFRGTDPETMGVLENSGIFKCYQLNTNYRSKESILRLANTLLTNIAANRHAKIQLRSNNLAPITEKDFTDAIQIHPWDFKIGKDLQENGIPSMLTDKEIVDKIITALTNNEKIIFLAHANTAVSRAYKVLESIINSGALRAKYPVLEKAVLGNIRPNMQRENSVLSAFINYNWDKVTVCPPANSLNMINAIIQDETKDGSRGGHPKDAEIKLNTIARWMKDDADKVNDIHAKYARGLITASEFYDLLKEIMLAYEKALATKTNQRRKQNSDEKNRVIAESNVLVSTIHSVKGLEFDHTIVLMTYPQTDVLTEADKRMYYVALTRAKLSEAILINSTSSTTPIERNYYKIIEELSGRATT